MAESDNDVKQQQPHPAGGGGEGPADSQQRTTERTAEEAAAAPPPPPQNVVPPTPEELHAILNRDYDVTRVSPLTLKLESPGPPRSIIVVQTAAQLTLPERRIQVRLPDEMVPDILAPAVQADNEARARREGGGGGGGGDNNKNGQQP